MPEPRDQSQGEFIDELVSRDGPELPDGFFDRFVFNLHPTDAVAPTVLLGFGVYPRRNVVDGFVLLVDGTEQRNLFYSTELTGTDGKGAGPFRFDVVEPNQTWRLRIEECEIGVGLDVTWQARAPYWAGSVEVENASGETTAFDHLVQSGRYSGTLRIDGVERDVEGWYGQRDRSRGVRTMSGGQGLHMWFQAQFDDRSVGFLLVEDRAGGRILLEGAVMHEDGTLDDIVDVRHHLTFDDGLDLRGGRVLVTTAAGAAYEIDADASARGGYMAGAGYGGHHGRPRGRDHIAVSRYALDGSVSPRTVDSALTDRTARFEWNGRSGTGIFEFAHSRSSRYSYVPTLD